MWEAVVKIILAVLAACGVVFGAVKYGKTVEVKNELKDKNDVLKEHGKIDATPDPDDPADQL